MELFPAIDILDGKVVRLKQGDYGQVTTYLENPVEQAIAFEAQGASWVHVVDLSGAKAGKPCIQAIVERIVNQTSLKIDLGGGIRNMETLHAYAKLGVQRLVMGTALIKNPDLACEAASAYPGRIVAGIDAKAGSVAVEGWTESSNVSVVDLALKMKDAGIADVVYTDIAKDGMQTGIDVQAYVALAQQTGMRVVASGGVSTVRDITLLAATGKVWGAIVGRALYEGNFTLAEALAACEGSNNAC